jgi:hypothetical protein
MCKLSYLPLYLIACMLAGTGIGHTMDTSRKVRTGYLIDILCARERRASEPDLGVKHTRRCLQMPICSRSGFGLFTAKGEVIAFDPKGNRLAHALIDKTSQSSHLRVLVKGTIAAGELQVTDISLVR